MIPRFTDEGLLPPGVHQTDPEEFKEKTFGAARGGSCSKGWKRPWS
jgi:hypothetical protein